MWPLIDKLSRPSLDDFLLSRARAYRRLALEVRAGFDPADPAQQLRLAAACHGLIACWQALGPALPRPLRDRVRANRRGFERLLRPSPADGSAAPMLTSVRVVSGLLEEAGGRRARRSVGSLLAHLPMRQSGPVVVDLRRLDARLAEHAGLLASVAASTIAEPELRAGWARSYRKARAALRRDPAARRSVRRLARLLGVVELIDPAAGRTSDGAAPSWAGPGASGRELLRVLLELHELAGLRRRIESGTITVGAGHRRRLDRLIRRRNRRLRQWLQTGPSRAGHGGGLIDRVFAASVERFEHESRWAAFTGLAASGWVENTGSGAEPNVSEHRSR